MDAAAAEAEAEVWEKQRKKKLSIKAFEGMSEREWREEEIIWYDDEIKLNGTNPTSTWF